MKNAQKYVVLTLAAVIFISFFLPWMRVESEQVGFFSKILTGKKQTKVASISGFDVPIMANDQDARLMISIIKIFKPNIKDADKKSYLIWSVPILAVIIALIYFFYGKNKWINLGLGIIGCIIFIAATYKLKTTDLDKMVLKITIAPWLWIILWSYLFMGLIGCYKFATPLISKKINK